MKYDAEAIVRALDVHKATGLIRDWRFQRSAPVRYTADTFRVTVDLVDSEPGYELRSLREASVFVHGLASAHHAQLRQAAATGPVPAPLNTGSDDLYTLTITVRMTREQRAAYAAEYGLDDGPDRPVTPAVHYAVRSDVAAHLQEEVAARVGEVYLIREFTSYQVSGPA